MCRDAFVSRSRSITKKAERERERERCGQTVPRSRSSSDNLKALCGSVLTLITGMPVTSEVSDDKCRTFDFCVCGCELAFAGCAGRGQTQEPRLCCHGRAGCTLPMQPSRRWQPGCHRPLWKWAYTESATCVAGQAPATSEALCAFTHGYCLRSVGHCVRVCDHFGANAPA